MTALTRPGRPDEPPIYPPPAAPIKLPNADDLTGIELYRIKGATKIDILGSAEARDWTEITYAIAWHVVSRMPEYQGITFQNVLSWPMKVITGGVNGAPKSEYDDADDVRETIQELDRAQQDMGNFGDGIPFTDPSEHGSA